MAKREFPHSLSQCPTLQDSVMQHDDRVGHLTGGSVTTKQGIIIQRQQQEQFEQEKIYSQNKIVVGEMLGPSGYTYGNNGYQSADLMWNQMYRSQAAFFQRQTRLGNVSVLRSSLMFQLMLYFNVWYIVLYMIAELLLLAYKGDVLPYRKSDFSSDVFLHLLLGGIEALRIYFGLKGNLLERVSDVMLSLTFSFPSLLGLIFMIKWQSYVLRVEVVLGAIALTFLGLDCLLGLIALLAFARAGPYNM